MTVTNPTAVAELRAELQQTLEALRVAVQPGEAFEALGRLGVFMAKVRAATAEWAQKGAPTGQERCEWERLRDLLAELEATLAVRKAHLAEALQQLCASSQWLQAYQQTCTGALRPRPR
jgi:hypothetical protein